MIFQRVANWLAQEVIVKGLSESLWFQRFVLRTHTHVEKLHSHVGEHASKLHSHVGEHASKLADAAKTHGTRLTQSSSDFATTFSKTFKDELAKNRK